jgi:glycosyltransferase involved in cell wall biosynthesis
MRILKLFDGDYPWDVRVEKVCGTLIAAGHEVMLVARNKGGGARRETLEGGLQIRRLPARGPASLSIPLFFNPLWVSTALAADREFAPDLILARDLPMAPLAVWLARRRGVPVVADLAEPYPDSLRSIYEFNDPSAADRLFRNPRAADWIEKQVLRRIDHAVVVCPEAGERLERRGLPPGRWEVVRNTPWPERFARRGAVAPELEGLEDRFILLFSGLLAGDRGLDTALDAMTLLRERQPGRFALVVVGEGPVRERLEGRARTLGLGSEMRFSGWVDYARLPDIIARAQVGLLPFHRCPHIEASLANKLFEYMSLGLPVVASDVPPHARVLDDAGSGVVFPPGDAAALAREIENLANHPDLVERMSRAGLEAAADRYNWGLDGARLVRSIERVAAEGTRVSSDRDRAVRSEAGVAAERLSRRG